MDDGLPLGDCRGAVVVPVRRSKDLSKVGIVTLGGNTNYGNRLQNFALQQAVASLGHDPVETLHGLPRGEEPLTKARRLLSSMREGEGLKALIQSRTPGRSRQADVHICPPERQQAISDFANNHIRSTDRPFGAVSAAGLKRSYDHFVVGSDQVWNPAFTHGNEEWFLSFAERSQRVAYAASFGIPRVPKYFAARYRKGLLGIPHLSVRECAGATIVRELTGRTPPVVLDPTMLVPPETWGERAVLPSQLRGRGYVLVFMLSAGDQGTASSADLSMVESHARSRGLELIDVNSPEDREVLSWSPLEFIGAIRDAELVVTDSFHAAVFAHVFNRPFLIAGRGDMNSRFETLLSHSGISGVSLPQVEDVERASDIDWGVVNVRIEERRQESMDFLREALAT